MQNITRQDLAAWLNKAALRTAGTRANLLEAVEAGQNAETLTNLVNEIAQADGEHTAYSLAADAWDTAVDRGADPAAFVTGQITRRLLNGADDRWSGRGNDSLRAQHDGFRRGAERILGY